ncbi:MAG: hypothetical protein IJA03_03330 [Bacteroidaceae bacterium]|nr:hypothetical protein [Bacteroidaceae bacterium]
MDILKQSILPYLKTSFEKDLLEAVLFNIEDSRNKLRLNNFAYAARELTRHFLERLAPDEDVCNAPWFKPHNPEKPNMITRVQRMKYAIQGYLSDEFFERELNVDFTEVSKNLKNSIDDLSKYTHVNPETFDVDDKTIVDISYNIMENTLLFFKTINNAKIQVMEAIYACIDEEMVSQFYYETPNEIDIMATHSEVLGYLVTDLTRLAEDDKTITMRADGLVNVRLQYGSNGDMRREEGYETYIKLPFTSTFIANYKNKNGDIHIDSREIEVDTASFYG